MVQSPICMCHLHCPHRSAPCVSPSAAYVNGAVSSLQLLTSHVSLQQVEDNEVAVKLVDMIVKLCVFLFMGFSLASP